MFINPGVAFKYKLANDLSNRVDESMERVWQCAVSFGRRIVCSKIDLDVLDCPVSRHAANSSLMSLNVPSTIKGNVLICFVFGCTIHFKYWLSGL